MKTPTGSLRVTVFLVICGIVIACGQGPTPTAQATSAEAAPAKVAAGPEGPIGGHDITILEMEGKNVLFDPAAKQVFVPRGNDYVRRAEGKDHFGNPGMYHILFNVGLFDEAAVDADLRLMRDLGYNTVRVFINTETRGGITDRTYGLSAEYIANLIRFLELADAYNLYVIITHNWLPLTEPYTSILTADDPRFGGFNRIFLTRQGVEASKQFWIDLITALRVTSATRRILAYEIQNNFYFDMTQPPFSLPPVDPATGEPLLITAANGITYNMNNADPVTRLMDESMLYFLNAMTAAIKAEDPTVLVTNGFFLPDESIRGSVRFNTRLAIEESNLDFVNLHILPHEFVETNTPEEYAAGFGVSRDTRMPIVIGVFGAFRDRYLNNLEAANDLVKWQTASCGFGADGWLTWTWDTNEQPNNLSALGDAAQNDRGVDLSASPVVIGPDRPLVDPENKIVGFIAYMLSPLFRPSPCPVIVTPPFSDPTLKIVGEEEVVFDWTTDRCEEWHIPDLAARAFRDRDGKIQLITSHYVNYRMVGPNFDDLTSDCKQPIMRSDGNAYPEMYNDREWIAAPYIMPDTRTIYALVHNEYQGHDHVALYPERCPSRDYFSCWYNSITLVKSTDGGTSYHEVFTPLHLVAALPYIYRPDQGPVGIRTPSNIILGPDDYYYAFLNVQMYDIAPGWTCLMRTRSLADPTSWRFWDGWAFEGRFVDPYRDTIPDPDLHLCQPVARYEIGAMGESITYNTYLGYYVLVGVSSDWLDGRWVSGIYYALSRDLIHWSHRKLLAEMPLPWTVPDAGTDLSILYPTLIDPDSRSHNFEMADDSFYLYYTRHNFGQGNLDRDLIRVKVNAYPSPAEAAGP